MEKSNRDFYGFVAIFFAGFLLFELAAIAELTLTAPQKKIAICGGLLVLAGIGAALRWNPQG